ncbi:hypothetical protein ACOMHN_050727 [Nucella lapillus]
MLSPCGGAGYQEVEENTTLTFTCDQYSGVATWVLRVVTGSTTSIGSCSSTCTVNIPAFTLTANSNTSSSLTTSRTPRDSTQSGAEYECEANSVSKKCGLHAIARPSPPTISCPSDFIPENTPLTCTCNANNIGQPGGRLRWYTGTGSDVSTEVVSANYDVTTLEMTRTVTRGDNGRKFRCVNNWTVKVNAASDYTASVACEYLVNGVNHSSALTYIWNILCEDKQQSTCTFRPRPGPNGDDNTVITCTATNSKNNNTQGQNSVTLDIKSPQISGYVNGHILYQGDTLTLTCTVIGGDLCDPDLSGSFQAEDNQCSSLHPQHHTGRWGFTPCSERGQRDLDLFTELFWISVSGSDVTK